MPITRRILAGSALTGLGAPPARAWLDRAWLDRVGPSRPLRWLVGYPPGGGTDVLARLMAGAMAPRLGQAIVIENRPGAATNIAAAAAAQAAPDGHTVVTAGNDTMVFNPALYRRLPFDADQGLRPLGLLARFHLLLCIAPNSDILDLEDWLAQTRARPGALDYGSPGLGSPHHLAMERLMRALGLRLHHVPHRGMAPVIKELMAGRISTAVVDVAAGGAMMAPGLLRPLAVLSTGRLAGFPAVPTAEQAFGLAGFAAAAWQGLAAPARLPDAIAQRLSAARAAALAEPAVQARMLEMGMEPLAAEPEAHRALIQAERAVYWPLIRELGLMLD
ncbi:Bug family tripartite tricarboxylate transporter substrate binding protein [Falsiroseomonas sp.]|uniref:Bug family tripartite tricarboxylate transporter substrate binding protein n=1 Tax=Falsiroseomonas sp. TaxID=2870721 RepID=UPI003F6FA5B0